MDKCKKNPEVYRFAKKKLSYKVKSKKVPRSIQGEKSSKDMVSSRNLVSTIGAQLYKVDKSALPVRTFIVMFTSGVATLYTLSLELWR